MIDCEYEPSRFCSDPPSGFGKAKRTLAFSCVADRFCSDSRLLPSVKLFLLFVLNKISQSPVTPTATNLGSHTWHWKRRHHFFQLSFSHGFLSGFLVFYETSFFVVKDIIFILSLTNILFYVDEYKSGAFWAKNFTIGGSDSWSGRLYEHIIMLKNII